MTKKRCGWANSPEMSEYHDEEWGNPVHDDRKIFEFMVLETFQAGLSWSTVLKKRENFRKAFHNFDPKKIAGYSGKDVKRLLNDSGIIRNKLKILATINNAQRFLEVQREFGLFYRYMWQFTNGKTVVNKIRKMSDYKSTSKESDEMSKDLKKRGFKFMGSTVCYAHMQAIGMVNDHMLGCFRR